MLKHLGQFINNHVDVLQIISAGAGGIGVLFMNIEFILKLLLATASLGYILWKWRVEYKKNKEQ